MNAVPTLVDRVRDIINDECIVRVPDGSKELPAMGGAGYYTWQFYLRRALLDPFCLQVMCDDFWSKFGEVFEAQAFQIAGVESACVPMITALVIEAARRGYDLRAFTIRKERKAYGRRNLIEGMPSPLPVVFVDDLTSPQHNAFWHAMYAINQAGLPLLGRGYVLVLKMQADQTPIIPTSLGTVTIDSLFTLSDFSMTLKEYCAEKERGPVLRQLLRAEV